MTQNSSQNDGMSGATDVLAAPVKAVLRMHLETAYATLVPTKTGPADAANAIAALSPAAIVMKPVKNHDEANALLAGLWLWHDFLDRSHTISQGIPSATGSFWHAIMHRREGDFSNSKYWYARCRNHPALATLLMQANPLLNPMPASKQLLRLTAGGWNPDAFVDLVESVQGRPAEDPLHQAAVGLQQLEWRVMFDHCARAAVG